MTFSRLYIVSLSVGLCLMLGLKGYSQTKISIPPAKVELSSLGKAKIKKREDLKRLKKVQKEKKEKLKEIKRTIKKNGKLPKDSVNFYTDLFSSLKTPELDEVILDFRKIQEDYSPPSIKEMGRNKLENYNEQWEEIYGNFDMNIPDSLDLWDFKKDSIHSPIDSAKYVEAFNQYRDRLKSSLPDSTFWEDFAVDSTLWDGLPSLPDSLSFPEYEPVPFSDTDSLRTYMVNYLEEFVEDRVTNSIDLNLPQSVPSAASVSHYVPSLEKFDFKKPTIPDEKLLDALVQKEVAEKKNKLTSLLSSDEKLSFKERVIIGGYFQYVPTPQSIELTPTIAYRITKKWRLGGGYAMNFSFTDDNTKRMALRAFTQYDFLKGFYGHLESEWLQQRSNEAPTIKQRATFLGIGKSVKYKIIQSDIQFLYNFDAPNPLQAQRFVFRFGLNFTK